MIGEHCAESISSAIGGKPTAKYHPRGQPGKDPTVRRWLNRSLMLIRTRISSTTVWYEQLGTRIFSGIPDASNRYRMYRYCTECFIVLCAPEEQHEYDRDQEEAHRRLQGGQHPVPLILLLVVVLFLQR
jgi:hypothetical protein